MKTKNKIIIAVSSALILCLSITGAYAFLTARTEKKTNAFTFGNIEIELNEPLWDALPDDNHNNIPDEAETISPAQVTAKDPTVTNIGENNAYVYLKVAVPKKSVSYADENGNVILKTDNKEQLFTYSVNENWTEFIVDTTSDEENNIYYYYFNSILAPDDSTTPLFTSVQYLDVIEGENEENSFKIDVTAYGVQSESGENEYDVIAAWNLLAEQEGLTYA